MTKLKAICVEGPKVALKAVVYGARWFNSPWLDNQISLNATVENIFGNCVRVSDFCESTAERLEDKDETKHAARFRKMGDRIWDRSAREIKKSCLLFDRICGARSELHAAVDRFKAEWRGRATLSEPLQS
jgi:hypothetical protein